MVEGCYSYLCLDTVPVLVFDYAVGVFSPRSNMTCNVTLAVLSLALARRKQGEERQSLRWFESNYALEFGREPLSPKKWNGPGMPYWKVMEKLKARHCVQINMHKTVFEGFGGN